MTIKTPEELLDGVSDQDSFIAFLEALANDFERERDLEAADPSPPFSRGKLGWENGTVDSVLWAAAAYADATRDRWPKESDGNVWKRCADILFTGKIYE
jgi:hypothetical protein